MIDYTSLRIYASEKARHEGKPLATAVIHYLRARKCGARCAVFRGHEGLYESGEISSDAVTDQSYNLPLMIDVLVPVAEADAVLADLQGMVHDGLVGRFPGSFSATPTPGPLPSHLLVRDVMTSSVVSAHDDFSVRAVVELLLDHNLKALPVVDAEGHPIGLVTTTDLLAAGLPVRTGLLGALPNAEREAFLARAADIPVTRIVPHSPVTILETNTALEAVRRMVKNGYKRLPVVDAHGRLTGMISRIDVMRAAATVRSGGSSVAPDTGRVGELPLAGCRALLDTDDALTAINVLVKQAEEQTAVVDASGRLVGMIGDRELVQALGKAGWAQALKRLFHGETRDHQPLSSLMRREVDRIGPDASIDEALRLMVERGLKRLPVVAADQRYLGMVRREALLAALSRGF